MEPSDIEKKSLEAHVELCAQRYTALELRLDSLVQKTEDLCDMISQVRDTVTSMSEKRNDQLIGWGLGIIGVLVGTLGWLIVNYVIK